jgi:hypothetical protein
MFKIQIFPSRKMMRLNQKNHMLCFGNWMMIIVILIIIIQTTNTLWGLSDLSSKFITNIQNTCLKTWTFCVLIMYCSYVFYTIFAMNRAYFPVNRNIALACLCNWDTTCLQWCKSWVFKHLQKTSSLYQFVIFDHTSVSPNRTTGVSFIFRIYTKICLRFPTLLEVEQKSPTLHLSNRSVP